MFIVSYDVYNMILDLFFAADIFKKNVGSLVIWWVIPSYNKQAFTFNHQESYYAPQTS